MRTTSVIVPAYNHASFLTGALESILNQTLVPTEVIVVDDGSNDRTPEVLSRFSGRVSVMSQENRGVSAARNAGAAAASGEVLAFLDADDVWLPRKLERQMARLAEEPRLGLVHCGLEEIDVQSHLLRSRLDGMEGWISREMLLFRRGVILGAGSTALVPSAIFREVGGFDESLSTSADWDFCYRVGRGYRVGFVPEVLVRYRMHGTSMHRNIHVMAKDMFRAYEKVFSEKDPSLLALRRDAYGSLHSVLAGSFLQSGDYGPFVRHALKSLALKPGNMRHFAGFPLRVLRRRWAARRRSLTHPA